MSTLTDLYSAAPSAQGGGVYSGLGFGPFSRVRKPGGRWDTRSGFEAWMAWTVEIDESTDALTAISGISESVTILGNSVTRVVSLQHPRFPNLYAQNIEWEDFGESGDADDGIYGGFTHTLITARFKAPTYDTSGTYAYMEYRGNVAPRIARVPASGVTIGGNPAGYDTDQMVGGADFEIVLHGLPAFNYPYYLARQNRANDAAWTFLGYSYPKETLLFLGPSWRLQKTNGNVSSWEVGLGFKATTDDFLWNYARDSDGSIGLELVNGDRKYPLLNFNELVT